MAQWQLLMLSGLLATLRRANTAGIQHICNSESFHASCPDGEVVVMEKAEYGRMEAGRCGVTQDVGHVGCRNDFLYLLDKKCSGVRECRVIVGGSEFYDGNTQCNKELRSYLSVSYTCVKVQSKSRAQCLVPKKLPLSPPEGFISSFWTDETSCGTSKTPWTLDALPGQTINLTILDFGALERQREGHHLKCQDVYGFVYEKQTNVNESICGNTRRERPLYSTTSHAMQVQLIESNKRRDGSAFLIRYRVIGCNDLTPPANSFYDRKGNEAKIGCEGTDITWRLVCNGNTWDGVVGNCTAKIAAVMEAREDVPMHSLLIVAAIIGATVVIAVLIVVSGVVYIKRYRHSMEGKANAMGWTLHYQTKPTTTLPQPPKGGTYRPVQCAHARPDARGTLAPSTSRATTLAAQTRRPPPPSTGTGKPQPHIWEMPLPDPNAGKITNNTNKTNNTAKSGTPSDGIYQNPQECTCSTTRIRGPPQSDPPPPPPPTSGDNVTTQSPLLGTMDDDVSCFYEPNMGHKYYVLERQDQLQQQPLQPTPADQLPPPPSSL